MSAEVSPSELGKILEFMVPRQRNVMVTGAPGIGKTAISGEFGIKKVGRVLVRHPGVEEPAHIGGLGWVYQDAKKKVYAERVPFVDLEAILTAEEPLLVVVDDFGQAVNATQCAYMPVFWDRMICGRKISDKVSFLVCTNRKGDRSAVTGILQAVRSRMTGGIYQLVVDTRDWLKWAHAEKLPDTLQAFVRFRENKNEIALLDPNPPNDISGYVCPRTVAEVGYSQREKDFPQDLRRTIWTGQVGEGWAAEYDTFLTVIPPNPDECIKNPSTAPVPDMYSENGPAVAYLLYGAFVKKCTFANFKNIITYLKRISFEFASMTVDDIVSQQPKLAETPEYIQWQAACTNAAAAVATQ